MRPMYICYVYGGDSVGTRHWVVGIPETPVMLEQVVLIQMIEVEGRRVRLRIR